MESNSMKSKKTAHFPFSCEFFQSYKYMRTSKDSKNNGICFCDMVCYMVHVLLTKILNFARYVNMKIPFN